MRLPTNICGSRNGDCTSISNQARLLQSSDKRMIEGIFLQMQHFNSCFRTIRLLTDGARRSPGKMSFLRRTGKIVLMGLLPVNPDKHDVVSKDTRTYRSFIERKPTTNETGWDRLKEMFTVDEFGRISTELNSVYQAGFLGFLVGVIYGGIIHSRVAYMNFMENNVATAFKSHLDAKRQLQNDFTVSFAKGGFKWGWRLALFTTSYYGIVTCISVYREKSSIYEYLIAGSMTGALYKLNMGLRGMTAGGIIGGVLGGLGGTVSLLLLHLSGTSMEEIRYWQYKWRADRDDQVAEAFKLAEEKEHPTPDLLKAHDAKVGEKITLENIK